MLYCTVQLQCISLLNCIEVTDAGVSALGAGCGQLQSIDLNGCDKVTDAGVSALGLIDICRQSKTKLNRVILKILHSN